MILLVLYDLPNIDFAWSGDPVSISFHCSTFLVYGHLHASGPCLYRNLFLQIKLECLSFARLLPNKRNN